MALQQRKMIQILHFVNPHLFFYKFRDDGFDKSLHEMEQKIYGTVYKKTHSTENLGELEIGDTVAVFMPHWNRWVRGQLKEVSSDGATFFVWAIDYGVPVVSKSSEIVKLPAIYTKMNVKCPHVYIGGLINCVPAEGEYDFGTDNMVAKEKSEWSKKAIEIAQTAIDCANQMKFEKSVEFGPFNRPEVHRFGHLMCQKSDGTWIDLTKCLSNAFVAKITTDDWFNTNVHRMKSIQQPEWKTSDDIPIPLTIKMVIVKHVSRPTANDDDQSDAPTTSSNQSIESGTVAENASTADNNVTNGKVVTKNKVNKKSSGAKCYGPFKAGPQTRPQFNQYPHGAQSNRGFGPMRGGGRGGYSRGGFGNQRMNYQHGGRMSAQSDQEYFESCFRKPTEPLPKNQQNSESGSSSTVEDSDVENHDEKEANNNEAKQEEDDPNKPNESANGHELTDEIKNDTATVVTDTVTVVVTPPAPATLPTPTTPPVSNTPPPTPVTSPAPATDVADIDAAEKSTNSNDNGNTA